MLSKFFKRSKSNDNGLKHNVLFAPNYLVKSQKFKDRTEYTMGGHSIISIDQTDGENTGLYFNATRTYSANKISLTDDNSLRLGFQSILKDHFLTLGTRKDLVQTQVGDTLKIDFKDGTTLTFVLENCSEIAKQNKGYACNLRTRISEDEIAFFTTKLINSYTFGFAKTGKEYKKSLNPDSKRKFREAAQSFLFILKNYY